MSLPTPTGAWAIRLDGRDALAAASLRLASDIQACRSGDDFWLRGSRRDEPLDRQLAMLPGAQRFMIDDHGRGTPDGCLLPTIRIPDGGWEPIASCFPVRMGTAALPGALPERLTLGVRRAGDERPCTALICAWEEWSRWVDEAPAIRLAQLRFSRSGQRALVLGEPLPPLPGIRCHAQGAVLLPAGLELAPHVDPDLLTTIYRTSDGDVVLTDEVGAWELVPAIAIVPASRASVRATNRAAGHE